MSKPIDNPEHRERLLMSLRLLTHEQQVALMDMCLDLAAQFALIAERKRHCPGVVKMADKIGAEIGLRLLDIHGEALFRKLLAPYLAERGAEAMAMTHEGESN